MRRDCLTRLAFALMLMLGGPAQAALALDQGDALSRPLVPAGQGPACGRGFGPPSGRGPGMGRGGGMPRHRLARMEGIPAAFRGLRNPLAQTHTDLAEGRALFARHCAGCHGERGLGDGPAAQGLWPPPANLAWTLRRPMASDGYLMWTIAEGGARLGTGMPAFGDALSETDRWKIITFLRHL